VRWIYPNDTRFVSSGIQRSAKRLSKKETTTFGESKAKDNLDQRVTTARVLSWEIKRDIWQNQMVFPGPFFRVKSWVITLDWKPHTTHSCIRWQNESKPTKPFLLLLPYGRRSFCQLPSAMTSTDRRPPLRVSFSLLYRTKLRAKRDSHYQMTVCSQRLGPDLMVRTGTVCDRFGRSMGTARA